MEYEAPKEIWERKKLGLELRQKFELYFLSLIFTLAALSVQTASRACPTLEWRLAIEIGGWLLLLSAGLVGLWRVSKMWVGEVGAAEYQASQWGIPNKALGAELDRLDKFMRFLAKVQAGAFLLGFACVVTSRAATLLCGAN